jgi:hypothetical protein
VGRSGLEPEDVSGSADKGLGGTSESGGAESGADSAENGPTDPDLLKVAAAWPDVSEPIKAAILAMIETARKPKSGTARRQKE